MQRHRASASMLAMAGQHAPWVTASRFDMLRSCQSTARQRQGTHHASAAELGLYWGAAAVAMIGLSYASVPLYKIFCAATGYGGSVGGLETVEDKLKRRLEKPNQKVEQAAAEREVTVWFNGDVADDMPWEFKPTQEYVRVRPGQSTLVFFTARNKSDIPVTGYSVYNVTPDKAAVYFNKIQCFCFEMQRLRANEEVDMPVFFYLDPELATDWNCRNVDNITLSYMFHKVDDEDLDPADLDDDAPTVVKLHGPPGGGHGMPGGAPVAAPLRRPALVPSAPKQQIREVHVKAASESKELDPLERYALNIGFNLLNKSIFKYFPFPWTVSTVHVVVGLVYCIGMYVLGFKDASFGRIVTKKEFGDIFGPASMHALGHIAANLSFAAVAISLTHTVKTLEPAFNVVLSQLILGEATPLPAVLSLIPIIAGVALASAGELSFNWMGFLTAMASNLTFGFRAVWSKMVMSKALGSTAVYAYTTLISVIICTPLALLAEGANLKAGAEAAIAKVGAQQFYLDLFMVGMLYHLYNQFAFNTLQRVSPVSHGVCNVVKRIAIIFSSVLFFNQVMTTQALIGTCIAIAGTWMYTEASKKKPAPKAA